MPYKVLYHVFDYDHAGNDYFTEEQDLAEQEYQEREKQKLNARLYCETFSSKENYENDIHDDEECLAATWEQL